MQNNYLLKHAIRNVWCAPDQDKQFLIELHRVTPLTGTFERVYLYSRKIMMPKDRTKYHIYTADRFAPENAKLLNNNAAWLKESWINIGDMINNTSIVVNTYNEMGIEIPKYQGWYMYTSEGSLLFAFEDNKKIPINYKSEKVYVRTYTNAYYSSLRETQQIDTAYGHKKPTSSNDILEIQTLYESYRDMPGHTLCYVNGIYVSKIDLPNVSVGDEVEFIYDSSVVIIDRFKVGDMDTFNSVLDNEYKYLLLRRDSREKVIDYLDDVDVHIVTKIPTVNVLYKGLYYHRNDSSSIRMVTHRDYSLSVDNVVNSISKIKDLLNEPTMDNLEFLIEIKVRNSGFSRPLIFEDNRIHELYKLDRESRQTAMLGLDALSIWKAENLENSWYSRLMGAKLEDLDLSVVEKAYGYNGISKLLGDTPIRTELYSGKQRAILPQGLINNSTFYEYDGTGKLIGYRYQAVGSQYVTDNPNTRYIEGIYGQGTTRPETYFGTNNVLTSTTHNYRVYRSSLVNGFSDNNWIDVTDDDAYYTIVDNKVVNSNPGDNSFFMVRTDSKFLTMDMQLDMTAGLLQFDLAEIENRGSENKSHLLPVPMGQLDIFLNGYSLIRDLDYYIAFPRVYIVNKSHLNQPTSTAKQNVIVRFTGFANKDLSLDRDEDYGFIEHGLLSNNNRFDVRDDKVMRITVGGELRTISDVVFGEGDSGVSIVNAINGKPYQIKDIVVPVLTYNETNVYDMRAEAIAKDTAVEDYLSIKLPEPVREPMSAIVNRYVVVSPFFSRIIDRMLENNITNSDLQNIIRVTPLDPVGAIDNVKLMEYFSTYEVLLNSDPLSKELNGGYITIHPTHRLTVIQLSQIKVRILTRLVEIYGKGEIDISPFVTIGGV